MTSTPHYPGNSPTSLPNMTQTILPTNNGSLSSSVDDNGTSPTGEVNFLGDLRSPFIALFVVITVLAILGNLLVVVTIWWNSSMRSTYYKLILNLAISDLIFASIAPFHAHTMTTPNDWLLGNIGCKLYYFVWRVLYAFSVLTLMVITVERYLAIKFPLTFRDKTPRTCIVITSVWTISGIFSAPLIYSHTYYEDSKVRSCYQGNWEKLSKNSYQIYYSVIFIALYVMPLIVMVILYVLMWRKLLSRVPGVAAERSKAVNTRRKRAKMLMILVLAFFICWTPWTMVEAVYVVNFPWMVNNSFIRVMFMCMIPVFISAAVNPFLYCFLSTEFRRAVLLMLGHGRKLTRAETDVEDLHKHTQHSRLSARHIKTGSI